MPNNIAIRPVALLLLATATLITGTAAAVTPTPPRDDRAALESGWRAQGLQQVPSHQLDLVYVRPGARGQGGAPVQVAPVTVEMRSDWQHADRALERARMRPREVQRVKDEVAKIVADELRQQLGQVHGAGTAAAPVLEARVLDLYLNAPDMQTASDTRTYTRSFGDMVLVAELRDGRGGPLLLGSWEHRPAREFSNLRLTTRVENSIELRAAAHAWARQLRQELDRLGAGS